MDVVPNYHVWTNTTKGWALSSWHWLFMAQPEPFPERMMILGSDQYSFIQRGIPALIAGTTRSGEARRIALEWLNTRYHAPGDDMAQTLDFDAAAQFTRHVFLIGYTIAQDDERPRWNPGNFYGERFGSK